jgi:hypothetical protein
MALVSPAAAALGVVLFLAAASWAQEYDWGAPPVAAAQGQENAALSDDQIDQLLQPVALYPDPLLAEILPASTYPPQVIQAAQWLQGNPNPSDQAVDAQPWEPSVKALVRYPDVLTMMASHADWLQALGAAFTDQPDDVTAAIQRLRQQAMDAQNLPMNTPEQQVIVVDNMIEILPADPDFCYVPDYDPILVYRRHDGRCWFGFRKYRIGIWLNIGFDWGHRRIIVGNGWHPGWDRNGRNWRHTGIVVRNPVIWTRNRAQPRPVLPVALGRARGGAVSRGPVVNGPVPVIPRVGAMQRPNPAQTAPPVVRGTAPRAASVLEQNASETKQAQQRFQQDQAKPVREAPTVREAPSSSPPERTSAGRSVERSTPTPTREPASVNVTSSNEARTQSDRGHQSISKKR